jgi:hypothetical protein
MYLKGVMGKFEHPPELYAETFLLDRNGFWKRLWYAIKYVFGSRYVVPGGFLMKQEDARKFTTVLCNYIVEHQDWEKSLDEPEECESSDTPSV